MDFGKYRYLQVKKNRQARKKQHFGGKLKEIKVRPRIERHDYDVKLRHSKEFLSKGHKLKVRLVYRGRELDHKELGDNLLKRLEEDLKDVGHVEIVPRRFGRSVVMMFGPVRTRKHQRLQQKKGDVGDAQAEDKPSSGEEV